MQPICYFTTNKVIFQLESTLVLKRVSTLLLLHSRHNLVLFLFPLHKPTAEQTNWTQFSPSHCCDTLKLKDCASSSLGEKCHFKSRSTEYTALNFFTPSQLNKGPKNIQYILMQTGHSQYLLASTFACYQNADSAQELLRVLKRKCFTALGFFINSLTYKTARNTTFCIFSQLALFFPEIVVCAFG